MDKELLKKYNLRESQRKFQNLCEYTFITNDINEDDDDEDNLMDIPNSQPQQPTPNQSGGDELGGGDDLDLDLEPSKDGESENDSDLDIDLDSEPEDSQLGDTLDDELTDDDDDDDIEMDSDDEVIDVDDLTNAQDKTIEIASQSDEKIEYLIDLIRKFETIIYKNDEKLEDLRKEFEVRNPTEVERLNLRSQDSLPFNTSPKNYWDKKSKDSNYEVNYDNSVSPNDEEKEYTIKRGEIENNINAKSISNTFDTDSEQDFKKIFGI